MGLINSFHDLNTWVKLVLQLFQRWDKTNFHRSYSYPFVFLFLLHEYILMERAHNGNSEASLLVPITHLSVNFPSRPSLGASEFINLKWRGWTCWSLCFFPAWHFSNSRGSPVTFQESKLSHGRRMCLCIKNGQDWLSVRLAPSRCP